MGYKAHLELLSPGTNYTLYLVGEDNFTKQPNLMNYEQIVQINFTTNIEGRLYFIFLLKIIIFRCHDDFFREI